MQIQCFTEEKNENEPYPMHASGNVGGVRNQLCLLVLSTIKRDEFRWNRSLQLEALCGCAKDGMNNNNNNNNNKMSFLVECSQCIASEFTWDSYEMLASSAEIEELKHYLTLITLLFQHRM